MNKKKTIISLFFNVAILVATIIGLGVAVLDTKKQGMDYALLFIYYTTLSNIFLMIASGILVVYESMLLSKKIKAMPNWVNIVKLSSASATTLTMLVVLLFLTPMMALNPKEGGMPASFLYLGANLIFHVLNPVLGILSFLLFENTKEIKFPQICFSLIFTGLYEIFYTTDIFLEWVPLQGEASHDWYGFLILVNGNKSLIPLVLLLFLGITFLIAWLLWLGNRKIVILEKKKVATK